MAKKDLEFDAKAKEIRAKVLSSTPNRANPANAIREFTNESMRYALNMCLGKTWVSTSQKNALLAVFKEQKDAINMLFFTGKDKDKAIQMLKPLFGNNSKKFIDEFQKNFDKMQRELLAGLDGKSAS